MKDWMGHEYGPGDYVVYAVQGGQSSGNMGLGVVVSISAKGSVTLECVANSRYPGYANKRVMVDTRDGTRIQWNNEEEHIKVPSHWIHPHYPGVRFTTEQRNEKVKNGTASYAGFEYVTREYHDYVGWENVPVKTTLNAKAGVKTILKLPTDFVLEWLYSKES